MGRRGNAPTVYAVAWPDRVIKIGMSINMRWLTFAARGAEIVELAEFEDRREARIFERRALEAIKTFCRPAFMSSETARDRLGIGGGGWTECFRIPDGMTAADTLAQCNRAMLPSNAQSDAHEQCAEHVHVRNGRTDLRRGLVTSSILVTSGTHAGGQQDLPRMGSDLTDGPTLRSAESGLSTGSGRNA